MSTPQFGKTAVYRLFNADDELIYVGVGSDPESRFRDHARDKPWWPDVARKTIEWHGTRDEALAEEFEVIRSLSPIHNRVAWEPRPSGQAGTALTGTLVPVRVLRDNLGRRVDDAFFRGEITIIEKNGEPRAAVVPIDWFRENHQESES